jgi:parallel beta-helix repeat protein
MGALAVSVGTLAMGSATAAEEITGCMDEDETASINESGQYVLAAGVSDNRTCIEIDADDVVLDGQGHVVEADDPDRSVNGIVANDVRNATVRNVEVRGWDSSFSYGLLFGFVTDGEISDVVAADNGGGVYLDKFNDGITVSDSTAVRNDGYGFFLRDATDSRLHDNTAAENGRGGIQSNAGVNNTLRNNTARDNGGDGVRLNDNFGNEETLVVNNTASNNAGAGFFTGDGDNNTLRDNGAYGNDDALVVGGNAATSEVERLDVGDSTAANTTLSMRGENVSVSAAASPPDNPDAAGIGRYFRAESTGGSSFLDVSIHYDEADVTPVDETTLALWQYDGTTWTEADGSTVDTSARTVSANLSGFSTVGAFAESTSDQPTFAVDIGATNAPVTTDDRLTVEATVENTATQEETGTVSLSVGGVERNSTAVTLGSGETKTVTLSWNPNAGDAGTRTATVASENGSDNTTVVVADATLADEGVYFIGQFLVSEQYNPGDQDAVDLERADGTFVTVVFVDENGVLLLPTRSRAAGRYVLTDDAGTAFEFDLVEQQLAVATNRSVVGNEGDETALGVDIKSNRNDHTVVVTSPQLDGAGLADAFDAGDPVDADDDGTTDGVRFDGSADQTLIADFEGVAEGGYTLEFDVPDTTAADTRNVTVESPQSLVTFAAETKVVTEELGDRARIGLSFEDTGTAGLAVSSDEDSWQVEMNVTDADGDGAATVLLNTDTARQDGTTFSAVGDDSVSDVEVVSGGQFTDPDRRIPATTSSMNVSTGGTETDVATLSLEDTDTVDRSLTVARAPTNRSVDGAIAEREANNTVADGDYVVLEIQAAGIFGYIEDDAAAALADDGTQNVSLSVAEDAPAGDDVSTETFTPVVDETGNTIFLVANASAADIETGRTYVAVFEIGEGNPYVDEGVVRSAEFSTVARSVSINGSEDPIAIKQGPGQTIDGTSSVASGTNVTVTIRSDGSSVPGGLPLLRTKTVPVENGEWTAEFDLSDVPENQTFSISASVAGANDTATGIVKRPASVSIAAQSAENGAEAVVDSAYLPDSGWVVIYNGSAYDDGPVDSVLGVSAYLSPGDHSDIQVALDEPLDETETVYAAVHNDTDGDATFDFVDTDGHQDGPYELDDQPVFDIAVIQLPGPTRTLTATGTGTTTDGLVQEDGDGFGVAVAVLVGLLGSLLALRRGGE